MSAWTRGQRKDGLTYEQNAAMWRLAHAMSAPLVDWDRDGWGKPPNNVHVASSGNYGTDPGKDDRTDDQ